MDKKLGERIRTVRLEQSLSQAEFAEKLGVSLPTINRFERGHRTPDADFIVKVGEIFGCDVLWVLTGRAKPAFEADGKKIPLLRRVPDSFPTVPPEVVASHICFPGIPDDACAIQVAGEEMLPTVRDGDLVLFRVVKVGEGDMVLYLDGWGEAKVRRYREGELVADHPGYPAIKVDEGVRLVGKVVQALRQMVFSG